MTAALAAARSLNGANEPPTPHDRIDGLAEIDKVIDIDQSPIGRTPRSNPAAYTGAFTPIRDWFAGLPEAKARRYLPGRFSFNVKGRRCETCQGDGVIKIEMHFLPGVYVTCEVCKGKPRCTPDKVKRLKRREHESVLDKMQARLDHMPEAMTIRRQTVEHPFGTLKAWMGSTHFLTRTLEKVKTEMSLQVLAYNMKRMINIFGVNPLMQAIAA